MSCCEYGKGGSDDDDNVELSEEGQLAGVYLRTEDESILVDVLVVVLVAPKMPENRETERMARTVVFVAAGRRKILNMSFVVFC